MPVRLAPVHQYPLVERGVLVEDLGHMGQGGTVVRDAQLPLRVELGAHRVDGLAQELLGRVVHGEDDGDQGLLGNLLHLRHQGAPRVVVHRVVEVDPVPVANVGPGDLLGSTG